MNLNATAIAFPFITLTAYICRAVLHLKTSSITLNIQRQLSLLSPFHTKYIKIYIVHIIYIGTHYPPTHFLHRMQPP